jgi:hypothetical protein
VAGAEHVGRSVGLYPIADRATGGETMKIEVKKVEKILATGYGKENGDS